MEHDKRTDAQLPQQYQPDQYQQPPSPPPQYMQPLQQYHQIPQSRQTWHPSPQFLQKQECHDSRRDGHIHIVSPYFPTFHDFQINSQQSETLPQQCYHQKQPQPLTTHFQPQTKSEALRPATLLHPNNSKSYPVPMPNTQQYQQGCLQQLCSNKTFDTVAPHQWHGM
ncbi:hypothetical protein E2C01_083624 [Portunus trituberculatus]|uniref:Uncharacterized protein n=1 Tax=Portunus trituberculatus TaxID=210409 RepID=A0A5B7J1R8_PORTR|nr:hypothetical protein [Portunus trituberculatus]